MPDEFNPFKPGTGLKDDFDGTVIDGVFTVNPQSGGTEIILMVACDDGEEYPLRYGVGPNWEPYAGGEYVNHPGGVKQLFSNNTAYSDFMVHAVDCGAGDDMFARSRELDGRGPQVAGMWKGMRFHFDTLPRQARRPKDNDDGTPAMDENGKRVWHDISINRTLPTKYLGIDGQAKLFSAPGGTAADALSAPTADPLSVLDAVTQRRVRAVAKDAASYEQFIDAMLNLTDVEDIPIMERTDIGAAVADEAWYNKLHNE